MNRLLFDGFDNFGLQIADSWWSLMRFREKVCCKVIIASVYDEAFVLIHAANCKRNQNRV
jgi:dipeptidase D